MKSSHNTKRFTLVLSQSLFEKMQRVAERNRRSTTQQIIVALELMVRDEEEPDADAATPPAG